MAEWKTQSVVSLGDLDVAASAPVLVRRSRWYCWFPSLIRQPNGVLWAVMSAYADIPASNSVNYLCRSRDGGLSWEEPRVIGDGGLAHLIQPDGSAVILPYYLRPRTLGTGSGGQSVGAPCNVLSPDGRLDMRASGAVVTRWPRPTKSPLPDAEIAGFVFNGQVVRGRAGEYLATLYGTYEGDDRYSLVMVESDDGFRWRIRAQIAGPDCALIGSEGPCESAVCRLKDGRLMCIFRLASFVSYGQTFSDDDGHTWTMPVNISPGSVEPSLAVLRDGIVALSGGRPGISVWFNANGAGGDWQGLDIISLHNAACSPRDRILPDSSTAWKTPADMRRAGMTGYSSCYTELMALDERTMLVIYDRVGYGWNPIPDDDPDETKSVWVMRLQIN
jgi:hypothetical protein